MSDEDEDFEDLFDPNSNIFEMIEQYDICRAKKSIDKKNLKCVVCSAKATGFNFDQITCESCKAFFRRNALRNPFELRCRFSGHCNITIQTRRYCAFCRIQKCFQVGMRKEWIQTEDQKLTRRRTKQLKQCSIIPQPKQYNLLSILSSKDRIYLNNITHCYNQYASEPCVSQFNPSNETLYLRLCEFYNRKKPIIVHFIDYYKHIPDFQQLNIDDQVGLVKENIRYLLPINYALLKTPEQSKFRYAKIQTIDCYENTNLHYLYAYLSNQFVPLVAYDSLMIKLVLIILFFSTNSNELKQWNVVQMIQTNYLNLLWTYMLDKYGENQARCLFMNIIMKYLHLQQVIEQIDFVIRSNECIDQLDELLKSVLQLT